MLAMAECGFTESAFQSVDGTPGGTGLQLASPLGSLPRTATVQVALTGSTLRFSDRFSIHTCLLTSGGIQMKRGSHRDRGKASVRNLPFQRIPTI